MYMRLYKYQPLRRPTSLASCTGPVFDPDDDCGFGSYRDVARRALEE